MHLTAPSHPAPNWSRSSRTGGRDRLEWVVTIIGMRTFPGSEDKTISGPLTESHGQALLLLSLPVRPELGHDGRRKRKRAPPPRRLRRLEAQATLAGLLERALDPQASPIKVDVLLTERT
jgi:hypothetical protein